MEDERRQKCSARVSDGGRRVTFHDCTRWATTTEDGKPWCSTHAPTAVKARRDERDARYKAETDRIMEPYRKAADLASLNALLVEALELARQHLTHGVSTLREFCNWGPGCPACAVEDALARVREGGA